MESWNDEGINTTRSQDRRRVDLGAFLPRAHSASQVSGDPALYATVRGQKGMHVE
jgi:hypothetical protein